MIKYEIETVDSTDAKVLKGWSFKPVDGKDKVFIGYKVYCENVVFVRNTKPVILVKRYNENKETLVRTEDHQYYLLKDSNRDQSPWEDLIKEACPNTYGHLYRIKII